MKFFLKIIVSGFFLCVMSVSSASAEIFYLEDQDGRFSMSFPDLWQKTNNRQPNDELTVVAPGPNDLATCRMRVDEERRWLIYPKKFSEQVQRVAVSDAFWDDYLGAYDVVSLDFFKDDAGLGQGNASVAEASYVSPVEPVAKKRGIMMASIYNDRLFVIDCSSEESVYEKWRPAFLGIFKSIDFKKTIHENVNGHYRPFMDDAQVIIQGEDRHDVYKY